jgi:hypothetical protein
MKIPLSAFEEHMTERKILYRGLGYFRDDRIASWVDNGQGNFSFSVEGTDLYTVVIQLDEMQNITSCSCSCPYDQGNLCKHEVACLFFLQENQKKEQAKKKSSSIKVAAIKTDLSKKDYQNLIKKAIKSAYGEYGHVEPDEAGNALYGARKVLLAFSSLLQQKEFLQAASLLSLTLETLIKSMEEIDDSYGVYWSFISTDLIEEALVNLLSDTTQYADKNTQTTVISLFLNVVNTQEIHGRGFEVQMLEEIIGVIKAEYFPLVLETVLSLKEQQLKKTDNKRLAEKYIENYLILEYQLYKGLHYPEPLNQLLSTYQHNDKLGRHHLNDLMYEEKYEEAKQYFEQQLPHIEKAYDTIQLSRYEQARELYKKLNDPQGEKQCCYKILLFTLTLESFNDYKDVL